uniref:FERM domain-containing protein n=1 Tax=Setaria digitata TaxID=48799 RepID=A0A915PZV8_9BILA
MPANETAVIPTSFIGRISARTSLISTRDYKTTVQLLDDNETICQEFKKTSNAQFILDYVCECLNIIEKDYFGLRYQDISRHRNFQGPNVALRFRVRFYPSDVSAVKEEITRYMLFVQLQRDLLHGRLYCPKNEAAVLGALALQSIIGDYDAEERPRNYVAEYRLLFKQTEKLEEKIAESHRLFKGLTPAEAEMEFLKRASKLDTYGFDPYTVTNKQKQTVYIGVTYRGIYIYHVSRLIHHITWNELEKVDYIGKEILITPSSSYVSPYLSEDAEGFIKPHKTRSVLKFHCPSAMFAKHLWRHILSQQAFFTETDARHIKPKFSKPRIPLLTRGSTFHFPTSRVLQEIEIEGPGKRDGPPPRFTRYPLLRQSPRQEVSSIGNKYNSFPVVRSTGRVSEVIPENMEEEKAIKIDSSDTAMYKVDVLPQAETSVTVTSGSENTTTFTIHLVRKEPLSSQTFGTSDSGMHVPDKDSFEQMLDAVKPLHASTATGNLGPYSHTIFATTATTKIDAVEWSNSNDKNLEKLEPAHSIPSTSSLIMTNEKELETDARCTTTAIASSTAKIFFSLLLFWLLLTAVAIALFEHDSPWLDFIPAVDSIRHMLYEPLRHHILALYVRLGRH